MNSPHAAVARAGHQTGRFAANGFIVLFIAVQLLLPLRYYCGLSGNDERFSWRMFSSLATRDRYVEVTEVLSVDNAVIKRRVPLGGVLHPAWISGLTRFDPHIVATFLRWYARRFNAVAVQCVLYQRLPDGTPLPPRSIIFDSGSGTIRFGGDPSS